MTLEEIGRSCPRIMRLRAEAHAENLREAQRLLAWHLAPILNLVAKRPVTPAKLLGEGGTEYKTKEEILASFPKED